MAKRKENVETTTKSGAAGRSRTVERRKEKQQQERRQQQTFIAIGLVVVVIVGFLLIVLTNAVPAEAPIPEDAVARYEGLEMTSSVDGYPRLGDPDAPVEVVEYSSFGCTACASFHESSYDSLIEYVRNGDINITFIPITTTGSIAGREGATYAALCAAEQNQFWAFHDTLFDWQVTFGNQAFNANRLRAGIEKLGLDMSAYDTCQRSSRPGEIIAAGAARAAALSSFGTPRIEVDGTYIEDWSGLNQAIEQRLAFRSTQPRPTVEPTAQAVAPTEEATPDVETPTEEATPEATP